MHCLPVEKVPGGSWAADNHMANAIIRVERGLPLTVLVMPPLPLLVFSPEDFTMDVLERNNTHIPLPETRVSETMT